MFLVGYMACGKTTFGRALAKRMGRVFYDLDFCIEQRHRRSVAQLFAERGEEGFRRLESAMLREAGEYEGAVIACGGGTPCRPENMDYMLGRGLVVHLRASDGRLLERLRRNRSRRPLVASVPDDRLAEFVAVHMGERLPHYSRAHVTLGSDMLESHSEIAATVDAFLALPDPAGQEGAGREGQTCGQI